MAFIAAQAVAGIKVTVVAALEASMLVVVVVAIRLARCKVKGYMPGAIGIGYNHTVIIKVSKWVIALTVIANRRLARAQTPPFSLLQQASLAQARMDYLLQGSHQL